MEISLQIFRYFFCFSKFNVGCGGRALEMRENLPFYNNINMAIVP